MTRRVDATAAPDSGLDVEKEFKPVVVTALDLHTPEPPVAPNKGRKSVKTLWPAQEAGYFKLRDSAFRLYLGPTGSGKSVVGCILADHDLDQGNKILIAVPQHAIAPGFGAMRIRFSGGRVVAWKPGTMPEDTTVDQLVAFLRSQNLPDRKKRIVVSTHQALVLAFARLAESGSLDALKGTALTIDEAHHSLYDAGPDPDEDGESDLHNRLGAVVKHYLDARPGPLTLITATWLRTKSSIVPGSRLGMFERFVHPVDEYLQSMRHLRNVQIRLVVGDPIESMRFLAKTEPSRKTLVFLPSISRWMPDRAAKISMLAQCMKAIGPIVGSTGPYDVHAPVMNTTCDLVTEEGRDGRDGRLDILTEAVRQQVRALDAGEPLDRIPKSTPAMVVALNMCREGFDWPEASRAILLAPRGSVLATIQMLGRLLRDWPGKNSAEFNIVLPVGPDGKADPTAMTDYLKVIFASLVVEWQFRRLDIVQETEGRPERQMASSILSDVGLASQIMAEICKRGISHDGDEKAWDGAVADTLDEAGRQEPSLLDPAVRDTLSDCLRKFFEQTCGSMMREAKNIPLDPKLVQETQEGPFGSLRLWAAVLGWDDLRKLRLATGDGRRPLTIEYVDDRLMNHWNTTGIWPTCASGNVDGDGRSWVTFDVWLRNNMGYGLSTRRHRMGVGVPTRPPTVRHRSTHNAKFLGIDEAKKYVQALGFQTTKQYWAWAKTSERPANIPACPSKIYANCGWVGMGDWLGTGNVATFYKQWRPYDEAEKYVRDLHLSSEAEWVVHTKSGNLPEDIPKCPRAVYQNKGWKGMSHWLGIPTGWGKNRFLPCSKAKAYARSLKLQTFEQWEVWTRTADRPYNIPSCPWVVYRDTGWAGIHDWLGVKAPKGRSRGRRAPPSPEKPEPLRSPEVPLKHPEHAVGADRGKPRVVRRGMRWVRAVLTEIGEFLGDLGTKIERRGAGKTDDSHEKS